MAHLQNQESTTAAPVASALPMNAISQEIGRLPHVKAILVEQHGDLLTVWTVVDELGQSVQYPIYDAEARLIDNYHRVLNFDFNVIPGDETTAISGAVSIPLGH